jgi:tripartite-type tricarboxylate transporter receptor subunit TctC
MRSSVRILGTLLAAAIVALPAAAQTYPTKSVRIVVPASPGGSNSIIARILGERLQAVLGQTFFIDNKGGAGGLIGVDAVAKAPPDGHTLLLTFGGPIATGLALFKTVPFDAARDLAPIARVADVPLVLVASPQFPAQTVKEVVAYAKANPGRLRASINSNGSMGHLLTEQFRLDNKIQINSIPYKGTGQAMTDLLGGQIDIAVDTVPALAALIKAGKLRPLAMATATRSEVLPEVPTFTELGMPGMEVTTWFALLAPAGTPKPIIDRLALETARILASPDVKETMAKQGIVPHFAPPQEIATYMRDETAKWAKIISDAGMTAE